MAVTANKMARAEADLCECGSGLRALSCCKLQKLKREIPAILEYWAPTMQEARQAAKEKRLDDAAFKCIHVIEHAPCHVPALTLLYQIRKAQNQGKAAETLLSRAVRLDPNQIWATNELALLLYMKGERGKAEYHARNAIRIAPRNSQAHAMMGALFTEANRNRSGEHHYRNAIELKGPDTRLYSNLAVNLKQQGRMDESEEYFRKAVELEPKNIHSLMGWVRMEEARQNFDQAWELLEQAEKLDARPQAVALAKAVLYGRQKKYDEALEVLDTMSDAEDEGERDPTATHLLEKGRLYDRLGRYDDAWECYVKGKARVREVSGNSYRADAAKQMSERLKGFFNPGRLDLLPKGETRTDAAQPLFIVGFPRSGTTMVEQTLTAHPHISAGDELTFIGDLTRFSPRMLNSPMTYPESLADLWIGENKGGLNHMRDWYLAKVHELGIVEEGAHRFTDKMPLNEVHLGLISRIFPDSPIIHLVRHPLDVIVSVFSNYLTHGLFCAFALETAAQHYALVADLVFHYREAIDMRYMPVKYEEVVEDQETHVRALLDFVGEPFDERCLNFHENARYARTASYAQVTEKLYSRSVYRYQNYRKHLEPIIPIVKPWMERFGYTVD